MALHEWLHCDGVEIHASMGQIGECVRGFYWKVILYLNKGATFNVVMTSPYIFMT